MSKLLTIKWMQLLVHIWRNRETNGKQQLDNLTRIGSVATHFQLPLYEFHWATRQARDSAISANSLGTWFFSKEKLRCRMQRLLEIIPYSVQNRGGIQERTVGLRFLGIILRVLRLEVSTLVLCLSTRCSSWTDLSFLHWLIVLYGILKP